MGLESFGVITVWQREAHDTDGVGSTNPPTRCATTDASAAGEDAHRLGQAAGKCSNGSPVVFPVP